MALMYAPYFMGQLMVYCTHISEYHMVPIYAIWLSREKGPIIHTHACDQGNQRGYTCVHTSNITAQSRRKRLGGKEYLCRA